MSAIAWFGLTVAVYGVARAAQARLAGHPLANTVLTSAAALLIARAVTAVPASQVDAAGRPLLWMLGPATVALAVPLYGVRAELRATLVPIAASLLVGSTVAVVSAVGIATMLGASRETVRSLAPKSVTTPIAMGVARAIGGAPSLAAVFVILTGAVGTLTATTLFDLMKVRDARARGFALGLAAHGMGTARAFQLGVDCGVFATLAMTLNGIVTSILLPSLLR